MYTSAKTRKKRRHVGPTCLKIPGENTALVLKDSFSKLRSSSERQYLIISPVSNVFRNLQLRTEIFAGWVYNAMSDLSICGLPSHL